VSAVRGFLFNQDFITTGRSKRSMNLSAPFPRTVLALTWLSCALAVALGFSPVWISLLLLGLLGVVGIEAFAFQKHPNAEADTSVHEIPNGTTPPSTITEDSFARASFLAKVSHELRTPLHNILGLLNIVYKNDSNATNRYYLRLIQDASSALLGTINDVLDYSKSDTGMLTVECKPMDLAETVRQALRTLALVDLL
jgi:signal transduction histidine kinase